MERKMRGGDDQRQWGEDTRLHGGAAFGTPLPSPQLWSAQLRGGCQLVECLHTGDASAEVVVWGGAVETVWTPLQVAWLMLMLV
jgi:hypothetical protein